MLKCQYTEYEGGYWKYKPMEWSFKRLTRVLKDFAKQGLEYTYLGRFKFHSLATIYYGKILVWDTTLNHFFREIKWREQKIVLLKELKNLEE